jgi:hypothetical protein
MNMFRKIIERNGDVAHGALIKKLKGYKQLG